MCTTHYPYLEMSQTHVHIQIYFKKNSVKNKKEKNYYIHNVDDNDDIMIFSQYLFPECFFDYNTETNTNIIRVIKIDDLKLRLEHLKSEINLPKRIEWKIKKMIIKQIEDNSKNYMGINIIH